MNSIKKSVGINSSPHEIWDYLTKPELMTKWMGEPEIGVEVVTDWIIGHPIVFNGFHHVKFENTGLVIQFDPHQIIQYSHLSSVSRLPYIPENYSILTFLLTPENKQTLLTLGIENFPTETIYKHFDFYWEGTLVILKNMIENNEKDKSH